MAIQSVTTFSTAQVALSGGGSDDLYVGTNGEIYRLGTAVVDSGIGSHDITVIGSIFSTASDAILLNEATQVSLTVGNNGTIAAAGGNAVEIQVSHQAQIRNNGMISSANNTGLQVLSSATVTPIDLTNTGVITGDIGFEFSSGVNQTHILNSGVISGQFTGLRNTVGHSGTIEIRNSGTISSEGSAIQTTRNTRLFNSGDINGFVSLSFEPDTVINLGTITGFVGLGSNDDTFRNIGAGAVGGYVDGSSGNDLIVGGIGAEDLRGGTDSDTIRGGAGNDQIAGGSGNDSLMGEDGHDMMDGGTGNDTMRGGQGDDFIDGFSNNDLLRGGGGDDTVIGGHGDDEITGDAGNDSLSGGLGNDTIDGGTGADTIEGGDNDDVLRGNDGNDLMSGDSGADTMQGGAGDDTLAGGLGRDILNGGSGADDFRFTATNQSAVGALRDVIQDFEVGVDTIDLGALPGVLTFVGGAALPGGGTAAVRAVVVGVNTLVQIDTDGNGTIDSEILLSFTSGVTADDFIL